MTDPAALLDGPLGAIAPAVRAGTVGADELVRAALAGRWSSTERPCSTT